MTRRSLRSCLWVGAVVLACGLLVTCVAALTGRPLPTPRLAPPAATSEPMAARGVPDPRAALRSWDEERAAAWIAADPEALAQLYTAGSVAGSRDVRLLRRWTSRSLQVTGMVPQVLALRVVRAETELLVLRVTDRVALLSAELDGRPVTLPRDEVSTRRVVLRRDEGDPRWRVTSVTGLVTPTGLGS